MSERGFIKDKADNMNTPNLSDTNEPFCQERKSLIEINFFDFNIPLHNDRMTVEKYLPPNTKLSFTIRKSSNDFLIWKDDPDKN